MESLRAALADGQIPTPEALRLALQAHPPELVAALLAPAEPPDPHDAYLVARQAEWAELGPIERLVAAQSERGEAEERLEALLGGQGEPLEALEALVRAGALWEHDSIWAALTQERARPWACCMLARLDPEGLVDWLLGGEQAADEEEVRDVTRALALMASESQVAVIERLLDVARLEEQADTSRTSAALEAALAVVAPLRHARAAMQEELGGRWLRDGQAVADFLSVHGETGWLETLAILELGQAATALEFASLLAVCASAARMPELDDERAHALGELAARVRADEDGWQAEAVARGFKVAVALGDEDLEGLLVEVAIHERLVWADQPSVGVRGLPLASNDEAALDVDAARELLDQIAAQDAPEDEAVAAAVRTLCDLRALHARGVERVEPLLAEEQRWEALSSHANAAVNLAARRLLTQLDPRAGLLAPDPETPRDAAIAGLDVPGAPELLAEVATGQDLAALWAARELTELALEDALPLLAQAWSVCSPWRAEYLRALLSELIATDYFVSL